MNELPELSTSSVCDCVQLAIDHGSAKCLTYCIKTLKYPMPAPTQLTKAIQSGKYAGLRALYDLGFRFEPDVVLDPVNKSTPLHVLAFSIKALLSAGQGYSVREMLHVLCDLNVDPCALNRHKQTARQIAEVNSAYLASDFKYAEAAWRREKKIAK